jgi:hypothetical protein
MVEKDQFEVRLTEDEIDQLVYESGPNADHDALVSAVERIVAARLAPFLAALGVIDSPPGQPPS